MKRSDPGETFVSVEENRADMAKKALALILAERERQDAKWGQQDHGHLFWFAILSEEVGEVAASILEGVEVVGLEPTTVGLQGQCSPVELLPHVDGAEWDLNPRLPVICRALFRMDSESLA